MVKLNQENLFQFLVEKKYQPILQKETNQIYVIMNISKQEVPIFFGFRGDGHLLQTIAYLPFEFDKNIIGDVGRLLHLLNKQLDMPGFGLDEFQKLMFYRTVIPCIDQQLNGKLVEMYLGTTRLACESFMDAIAAICSGAMRFEDLAKKTQ